MSAVLYASNVDVASLDSTHNSLLQRSQGLQERKAAMESLWAWKVRRAQPSACFPPSPSIKPARVPSCGFQVFV